MPTRNKLFAIDFKQAQSSILVKYAQYMHETHNNIAQHYCV